MRRAGGRVERAARELLEEHEVTSLPVPVHKIAKSRARLSFEPFDGDVSGLVYRDGNLAGIGVNSRDAATRQRFTIAHELGHLLLHDGRRLIVDKPTKVNFRDSVSSMATDREEIEANAFAAELLMPAKWVHQRARSVLGRSPMLSEEAVAARLAELFNVSPQAMSFRLINLGIAFPDDLA